MPQKLHCLQCGTDSNAQPGIKTQTCSSCGSTDNLIRKPPPPKTAGSDKKTQQF